LLDEDVSRTSNCALFFLKKGFPFVSVLRGGFAAAHAFLFRNGPTMGLPPSEALIDYDPVISLFAQLEVARQNQEEYKTAPTREKTARTLQKIIDVSMTRLTLEEQRINGLASDLSKPETVDKMKQSVSNLFHRPTTQQKETSVSLGRTPPLFFSKTVVSSKGDGAIKDGATAKDDGISKSFASFTEKFKKPVLHSDLSGVVQQQGDAIPNDVVLPEKEDESTEPPETATTKQESSIFTQFQSKLKIATSTAKETESANADTEVAGSGEYASPTISDDAPADDTPATKEGTERELPKANLDQAKKSFSSFAQKLSSIKPPSSANLPTVEATDDTPVSEAPGETSTSDKFASSKKMFSSFTTRIATSTSEKAEAKSPEENTAASEKNPLAKMSFASFSLKKPAASSSNTAIGEQDSAATGTKIDTEESTVENTLPKMSFGGFSLKKQPSHLASSEQGSTATAAETDSEEGKDSPVKKTFASFSKSFGGTFSGVRTTPASSQHNPFASLMQVKTTLSGEGHQSVNDVSKHASTSAFSSMAKFLSEHSDPSYTKPAVSRFSRPQKKPDETNEDTSNDILLFQQDDADDIHDEIDFSGAYDAVNESSEILTDDLFSALDPQPHGDPMTSLFGDVDPFASLADGSTAAVDEEKL
jgi:hypothetical protein